MASLRMPEQCKCGSKAFEHRFHPERWDCSECNETIISRKTKPQTGICQDCGAKKNDEVPFKPGKNQCLNCYNNYMREWNRINHDKQLLYKRQYYEDNKEYIRSRSNAYYQSDWTIFLKEKLRSTKKLVERRISKTGKFREFSLNIEELEALLAKQEFKCALTKLPLKHEWNHLQAASIDRIDSDGGYVVGNVQLVCQCINLAKNNSSNDMMVKFLEDYFNLRSQAVSEFND